MSILEKKINALARMVLAETEEGREDAALELRRLMTGADMAPKFSGVPDSDTEIHMLLRELGVPVALKGYPRLVYAIHLVVEDADCIGSITKGIYPMVAEKFNDTASRVERSIRHAIEVAWDRGDMEVMQKYFGNTISSSKGKPTNGEFIANAAHIVRMQMKAAA